MISAIGFICVGKLKEKYYREACDEYLKRLGSYTEASVTELKEYPADSAAEVKSALAREAQEISAKIPKGSYVISLCVEGRKLSSEALSETLEKLASGGAAKLCVVIGGSNGLDNQIKERSDLLLSMSDMTFPHNLARVMALEQFYRALSISANAKYHK